MEKGLYDSLNRVCEFRGHFFEDCVGRHVCARWTKGRTEMAKLGIYRHGKRPR